MSAESGLLERRPPQSQEAERAVLGALLRDNQVIADVVQILKKEDFYADAHQKIFETIVQEHDKGGKPVDMVTLAEALKLRGYVEDVGGYAYLVDLFDATPTAANAEYYARIVRDKAKVRNLIHAGTEILSLAYAQQMPADELVETAERTILDLAEKGTTNNLTTLAKAIEDTYDRIDRRNNGESMEFSGLSTGFTDLNELTAGLQPSELIIVAARPSVGKTAFSLGLVRNIIVGEREAVFFVSLEQSRVEIAERLLCSQARVDSHRLRKGTLTAEDMEKLIQAGSDLREAKLFIDDTPAQGMTRISANARRLHAREGIKLVVIDYLQLIEPENRRDPRQEQVAQISRRLKFLARELKIPVVALAQVNRASEDRQDHRPRLSDLRESGCLTGDTLIRLANSDRGVPLRDLIGKAGFTVWALDEDTLKLRPAVVSRAFTTGRKPVFRLTTRRGRTIRATANHRFRAINGWKRLDELTAGEPLALPGVLPAASNGPLTKAHSAFRGFLLADGCTLPCRAVQYKTQEKDLAAIVPSLFWRRYALPALLRQGITVQLRQPNLQTASRGTTLSRQKISRHGPSQREQVVDGEERLQVLARSEISWDPIQSITPDGEEDVFDLTVPGPANFVANDIIVHNSIEQDADTVMMLHRPDRYEPGQTEGVIEVIVAKNRNGPVGEITLAYLKQYLRYEDFKVGTPFDS